MEIISIRFSLLILSFLCSKLRPCSGADRITPTQSLSGDQTIISSGEAFELGFFKPGISENYYVGIWYKQVSPRTVVWVANRDSPVSDRFSSELKISDDGNLVLFNESKQPIWSTNLSSSYLSVNAVLLLEGNLILLPNGSSPFPPNPPLWQSFDHPSDTWISSSKIGFNKNTQKPISLTSWKSKEDPGPGPFFLKMDTTNQSLRLWNKGKSFMTVATFSSSSGGFSLVPETVMQFNFINNFSYVENQEEIYFTYSPYNITQLARTIEESDPQIQQLYSIYRSRYNSSLLTRFVVDVGGQIQLLAWLESTQQWLLFWWQPRLQCEVYGYCGEFASCSEKSRPFCHCLTGFVPNSQDDYSSEVFHGGCSRRAALHCLNDKPDRFLPNYNMELPEDPEKIAGGSEMDCEAACLSNCSCTAYSYSGNLCLVWYGDLFNLQHDVPNGKTIFIRLSAYDSEFSSSVTKKGIVVGAVVGSIALIFLVVSVILRWRKQKSGPGKVTEGSVVAFTLRDLQIATKNFAEKLGEGGFGSVYKGKLPDSSVVAVKKVEGINFSQAEKHKQFLAEVRTLGVIQHLNLVGFKGFACDTTRMLLVYDYMPNGSLASHMFKRNESRTLNWKTRYNIALGTARGLAYLHEKCRECILHCDIKPDNVLLDGEFQPKLADFGMAKLFGRDFSRVLTTLRGTIGYLAPEWISGEAITAKADVYSYGMMLFELVSGRRNTERHPCVGHYFPIWVAIVVNQGGDILQLLDPRLEGNADSDEVGRICRVALWCIQDDESRRPVRHHNPDLIRIILIGLS